VEQLANNSFSGLAFDFALGAGFLRLEFGGLE